MTRDLLLYAVLVTTAKVLQFLLLPVLTRLFAPLDYGFIELITTAMGLVGIVMTLSIESALARHWHAAETEGSTARLLSSAVLFVVACGATIAGMLSLAAWWRSDMFSTRPDTAACVALAAGATFLGALSQLPLIVLRMERRVIAFGLLGIVNAALSVGLALFFILELDSGIPGVFAGALFAACICLTISLWLVRSHLTWHVSGRALRRLLGYCVPMAPAVTLTWVTAQFDRIILVSLSGLGALGLFGAAARVAMIVGVVVEVFRLAWVPLAMRKLDESGSRAAHFRAALTRYLALMLGFALLLSTFSRELLVLLTTPTYAAASTAMPWLAGAQVLYGAGSITNAGTLAAGKTAGNSIGAAVAVVVGVAISWTLVPRFGFMGSAVGTLAAACVFASTLAYFSFRSADMRFDIPVATFLIAAYVVASLATVTLQQIDGDRSLPGRLAVLVAAWSGMAIATYRSIRHDRQAFGQRCAQRGGHAPE